MDQALVGFVRALRVAGADASPAETIDAAETLALVGYADRQALKQAWRLVLAKTLAEKDIFDQVFDRYFASHALAPAPAGAAGRGPDGEAASAPGPSAAEPMAGAADPKAGDSAGDKAGDKAGDDAGHGDAGDGPTALERLLRLADAQAADAGAAPSVELALALVRAAQRAGIDEIRFASQQSYYTARLLDALPIAPLDERLRELLLAPTPTPGLAEAAELARLQAARARLQGAARAWVAQRFELYGRGATESFMNQVVVERPLGRMSPPDMLRMKTVVARMARRLAIRYSRRRRVTLRTQIDVRRTVRANAGHDGVPVHLEFKHRRRDKPRITAVCDVSGSVASHVRFLLLFLYALRGEVTDLRCFAFSDRLKAIDAPLQTLPFDDAMDLILRELGHGSTDYGQALADLEAHHADAIDRQTTLLILGDGRSNHSNPRLDLMAELADRAKRVVWLCPEPPHRWGSGDSVMRKYQPYCNQLRHCANVADLERAVDDALAAYA